MKVTILLLQLPGAGVMGMYYHVQLQRLRNYFKKNKFYFYFMYIAVSFLIRTFHPIRKLRQKIKNSKQLQEVAGTNQIYKTPLSQEKTINNAESPFQTSQAAKQKQKLAELPESVLFNYLEVTLSNLSNDLTCGPYSVLQVSLSHFCSRKEPQQNSLAHHAGLWWYPHWSAVGYISR